MCAPTIREIDMPFAPYIVSDIIDLRSNADVKINTLFLKIISRPYTEQSENFDVRISELGSTVYHENIYDIEFNAEFSMDLYIRSVNDLLQNVIKQLKREGVYGGIECQLIIGGDIKIDQSPPNPFTITITKSVRAQTATNVFEYELLGLEELPQNADPETTNPETAV